MDADTHSSSTNRSLLLLANASTKRICELREEENYSATVEHSDANTDTTIDASVLMLLDFGVEIALERAKRWSVVTKTILLYVDKQASCMIDYARLVNKTLLVVKPTFLEQVIPSVISLHPRF